MRNDYPNLTDFEYAKQELFKDKNGICLTFTNSNNIKKYYIKKRNNIKEVTLKEQLLFYKNNVIY